MYVASVRLHYFLVLPNIIWLPWQRPLTNWKIRYRSIICTQSAFIMLKRLWKSVQYIRIYSAKYASFLAVSYQTFTNELCQHWSYWTEVHEIFTRYRSIIYAINVHIEVAISHSVSKCQSNKRWEFAIFSQNWLPWQHPSRLEILEKEAQIDHLQTKRFHSVKIGTAIIALWAIIWKKENKKRFTLPFTRCRYCRTLPVLSMSTTTTTTSTRDRGDRYGPIEWAQ